MIITAHIKPGAKKDVLKWIDADTAKIHVRAVAEKGRANEAVIELLARELKKSKSHIEIVRGHSMRIKQIKVM